VYGLRRAVALFAPQLVLLDALLLDFTIFDVQQGAFRYQSILFDIGLVFLWLSFASNRCHIISQLETLQASEFFVT
jgi:hypothetical protein